MVDMRHMEFIDRVAAADCDVLREKEGTYKGSWKAAGGRSAWFMMRRNMDRLLNMMQKPDDPGNGFNLRNVDDTIDSVAKASGNGKGALDVHFPGSREATVSMLTYLRRCYTAENIFAMVRDNASGNDGTVLAVLRDLRRYLILIEAEMMARGVVPAPVTTKTPSGGDYLDPDLSLRLNKDTDPWTVRHLLTDTRELNPHFDSVISEGVVHQRGKEPRTATAEDRANAAQAMSERRVPRYDNLDLTRGIMEQIAERTPEDGGHHMNLTPWEVSGAIIDQWAAGDPARHELFEKFYKRYGLDNYRLETTVESVDIPRELSACYAPRRFDGWIVRVERVPDDMRDCYPRLQVEMNAVEYDQSLLEFRYMYELRGEKWTLMPSYAAWARET